MKNTRNIILTILLFKVFIANAQLKVGVNPTTISSNANLQVESSIGNQVIITRDSSRIGIGTLTPSNPLHVVSSSNPLRLVGLQSGAISDSILVSDANGVVKQISSSRFSSTSNTQPWFSSTTNTGATSNTENIYQMGRVGIGTSNPSNNLQINSPNSSTLISLGFTMTGVDRGFDLGVSGAANQGLAPLSANDAWIRAGASISPNNQNLFIGTGNPGSTASGRLGFVMNNTERMTIVQNGNVGIGTTNPFVRLEVDGAISTRLNAGLGSVRLSPGPANYSGYLEFFNSNTATRSGYIGYANNGNFLYTAENGNKHYFQGSGIYVAGANTYNIGNFVFYSNTVYTSGTNGFYTGVSTAGNNGYSIYAVDRIACAEVNIFSDRRVKNVIGTSNANQDLATLMKLSIKDYTMKDFIENGNRKFKKVIAQEVEEVFPQAISQSKNFIPNIFAPAKAQVLENQIELTLSKTHELKSQDTLKIYFAGKEKQIKVLETPNNKTIRISKQDIDIATLNDVFVYGQYVHDFRTVDYDALSMLNISATQELYRKIEALEKQNQQLLQLQSGFETLKAEIQNLKKDMNKDLSLKSHLDLFILKKNSHNLQKEAYGSLINYK